MTARANDPKGRWRSVTVGFRVSPEEAATIDALVAMSGLSKQDYIARRLTERAVNVMPSSRLQRGMREQAMLIYQELRRIAPGERVPDELADVMGTFARTFEALGIEPGTSRVTAEEDAMRSLGRDAPWR